VNIYQKEKIAKARFLKKMKGSIRRVLRKETDEYRVKEKGWFQRLNSKIIIDERLDIRLAGQIYFKDLFKNLIEFENSFLEKDEEEDH